MKPLKVLCYAINTIKKKFQEEQRNILVGLIATFYEDKLVHLSLSTSYRLEKEILERFPSQKLVST